MPIARVKHASHPLLILISALLCMDSVVSPMAWAKKTADPFAKDTLAIPKTPSPPPDISSKAPSDIFRCERYYTYKGEKLTCDSTAAADGEKLRPLMMDSPDALTELDTYQRNRRRLRSAAYIGTGALLAILATSFAKQRYSDAAKNATVGDNDSVATFQAQADFFNILYWTSIGIGVGTVVFGVSMLQTNEAHLGSAVQHYNHAHPTQPIELQFSTEIPF